jgi:hypothetical protein
VNGTVKSRSLDFHILCQDGPQTTVTIGNRGFGRISTGKCACGHLEADPGEIGNSETTHSPGLSSTRPRLARSATAKGEPLSRATGRVYDELVSLWIEHPDAHLNHVARREELTLLFLKRT